MEWEDVGLVLSARPHGESSAILSLLTGEHGRHAGLARGARSRSRRGALEPGTLVRATWRARLTEHLGSYVCEGVRSLAAPVLADPGRLSALASVCALLDSALPEREPHLELFGETLSVLEHLPEPDWGRRYVVWEIRLLEALGFGFDLSRCAVTGRTTDLAYVSPRTGRAVTREVAAPYVDRLLPLPPFLVDADAEADQGAVLEGLRLTGHFLARDTLGALHRPLPPARHRLVDRLTDRGGR